MHTHTHTPVTASNFLQKENGTHSRWPYCLELFMGFYGRRCCSSPRVALPTSVAAIFIDERWYVNWARISNAQNLQFKLFAVCLAHWQWRASGTRQLCRFSSEIDFGTERTAYRTWTVNRHHRPQSIVILQNFFACFISCKSHSQYYTLSPWLSIPPYRSFHRWSSISVPDADKPIGRPQ